MKFVDVIIDNKSEYTDSFFTYMAPDDIAVGDKVEVPFARRRKPAEGYVVSVDVTTDLEPGKVKEIASVDRTRSLNKEMIDTALWMRKRYGVKYIDAVKMFAVNGKRDKGSRTLGDKTYSLPEYELTDEQKAISGVIEAAVESGSQKTFLIKGVTNSGKTEVYIQAVAKALDEGKTAIVLVPEIALAAQTEVRFKKRFGEDAVAVMHSKLSVSQRLDQWLRIRDGRSRIVIGARTAVFAPLENIGVIVIDEEHESTYKSDHNPKYETIDVAYRRASCHSSVLILGSATPSVISYNRAEEGIYQLLEMNNRIGSSRMPDIAIVDMRDEARRGNLGNISTRLYDEIEGCLSRKEQVILFLNRRGFSTQIMCPECGFRMTCEECGITLTYHKAENAAVCHYCGRKYKVPDICPECGNRHVKFVGAGTEKIEETVKDLFPEASVDRFDLDTAKSQREIDRTISSFMKKKTDILIGTQILAKGLDFKNVGLVGVIMADVTLNIPDYRSSERTYQLLTQVAGRAGRDTEKSRVIIQTYEPDNEAIKAAQNNDYENFYQTELLHRKIMNYPPYSDIIAISFTGKKERSFGAQGTMEYAKDFSSRLGRMKNVPDDATVFAPREDTFRAGADRERTTFIIKAPKGSRSGYVQAYMDYRDHMIRSGAPCYVEIDINPYGII